MNVNIKGLTSIYFNIKTMALLFVLLTASAATAYYYCEHATHLYAKAARFKVAELGFSRSTPSPGNPFLQASGKSSPSTALEAIGYLEFEYLARSRSSSGVRLVEAKEQKSMDTIQVVAEGPSMDAIDQFLALVLRDLQGKYQPSIDSVMNQGLLEVNFLNREIESLETLKAQVERGIKNVGPAPALVSQMMEINQGLVKLKQDYFGKSAMISPDKVHNFRLDTVKASMDGAPVWPKTRQVVSFTLLVTLFIASYLIFIFDAFRKKKAKVPVPFFNEEGLRRELEPVTWFRSGPS